MKNFKSLAAGMGLTMIRKSITAVTATLLMLGATSAKATLIGDSVQAAMSTPSGIFNVVTQFTSPAIVGAGTEFSGGIEHASFTDLTADILVDVTSSGFTVTGLQTSGWTGHGGGGANLRIDLSDLDWVGLPGEIIGINDLGGAHSVFNLGFGPHSAFVEFENMSFSIDGSTRSFSFDVRHIPEPDALALFGLGLLGLGFARRKRVV